jgi:hypothetical protein
LPHTDGVQYTPQTSQSGSESQCSGGTCSTTDDSAGSGSNRYATLLLYLTGAEEGGETAFTRVSTAALAAQRQYSSALNPVPQTPTPLSQQAVVDASGGAPAAEGTGPEAGSGLQWLTTLCQARSRLTVRPKKGQALLFYTQRPDGTPDLDSEYAECPVLKVTIAGAILLILSCGYVYLRGTGREGCEQILGLERAEAWLYSQRHAYRCAHSIAALSLYCCGLHSKL